MARTITKLPKRYLFHSYAPKVEIIPINPVYGNRMYISGWLFGFSTKYKREMVSCDGYKEIHSCAICGLSLEDELHQPEIIRTDRI